MSLSRIPTTTGVPRGAQERILFVDDDQRALRSLAKALQQRHARWDMVFALSAVTALDEFAKKPFDVIVCDLRMPVMDGVTLLGRIKERYPNTVRILLLSCIEPDTEGAAKSVAYRVLRRPCDADRLMGAIVDCDHETWIARLSYGPGCERAEQEAER